MNKPRLIDANELHYALIDLFQEIDDMYIAGRVISLVNLQPTAYDIQGVVEQLEGHAIEFETFGMCSDYVELTHAIEIVKGGVVDDETMA